MTAPTLSFELRYRKEGRKKNGREKMQRDEERYNKLPDVPAQFTGARGGYKYVANRAVTLNESQLRSGFLDYLFFPEVSTAPKGSEALDGDTDE